MNPEKFSPAEEIKKLEDERISSGMLALYPELWGPIEEERREEIKQQTKKKLLAALEANDDQRVAELIYAFQELFGRENEVKREASEQYALTVPEESKEETAESETAKEIRRMFSEADWENIKYRLEKYFDFPSYYGYYASEMRKFDQNRFDREIKISDGQWKKLVENLPKFIEYPIDFLKYASALKTLDPEKFKRDVEIEDAYWDKVADDLKEYWECRHIDFFVELLKMVSDVDEERMQKLEIDHFDREFDWKRIKEEIEEKQPSFYKATLVSNAQAIKPEGYYEDITISKEQWEKMKFELDDMLKYGADPSWIFSFANSLMSLKVE